MCIRDRRRARDTAWPWKGSAPCRRGRGPPCVTALQPTPSALFSWLRALQVYPQEPRYFFLHVDYGLRLPELPLEPLVLALEPGHLGSQRVLLGLGAPLLR